MLKNLTPHEVCIYKLNGVTPDLDLVIGAGEEVARVSCEYIKVDKKGGRHRFISSRFRRSYRST